MPIGSDWYTSGLSRRVIRGKSTSPNIAVHSWWSAHASSGERRERCKDEKAWCRISRQGLTHWVASALNIGDQYAIQAAFRSAYATRKKIGAVPTFFLVQVRLLYQGRHAVCQCVDNADCLDSPSYNFISPYSSLAQSRTSKHFETYCAFVGLADLFRRPALSNLCSCTAPTLPAVA